ncbi:GNAT family N-acetyltransferase [Nocardioides daejeonensis]|uniref:GNAT family N-acetyltransferase n=1 Tax=Nocardioides daejeonensis TaxID=1046556 RepID=UPI000D743D42|nr:GNAT family N-acetyltransferase [Nocardioides daejeonensis]
MIPDENRFESTPDHALQEGVDLPHAWRVEPPDGSDEREVLRLRELLRGHQADGRGWPTASIEDVLVEVGAPGLRMRENVVVRDRAGTIRAWGSVHDRAAGRMLFQPVVDRDLADADADACAAMLLAWAEAQAQVVGVARGLEVQQIDVEAYAEDQRQHKWLENAGFHRVRRWWQMSRPVAPAEVELVPSPALWERDDIRFRLVRRTGAGVPDVEDLRAVHDVLEEAFTDHFNSKAETFDEFLFRLREDPGHRWDHWWLAELEDGTPVGALVGSELPGETPGSYVAYIGVRSLARGRGVAKGLLHTIVADAAMRGRVRVGLEVDADSPTGAEGLYTSLGWVTKYVTESWHKDVPVTR